MNQINYYGLSFIGRRKNNEDAILQLKVDDNTWCFAIADGMGGVEGGEVASNEVIAQVEVTLKSAFTSGKITPPDLKITLEKVFVDAQDKIADIVQQQSELQGMGTTLTLLLIHQDRYVWGNIGDSRIYLAQGDSVEQITNDHTYIEQYRKDHNAEVPEGIASRYSNIITRAISGNEDQADIFPEDKPYETLENGDLFLLCSDGLITSKTADSGVVFLPYLHAYKKLKTVAEQLVARAFHDGSGDNISAVVVINGERPSVKSQKPAMLAFPPVIEEEQQYMSVGEAKKPMPFLKKILKSPLKLVALLLTIALAILSYQYIHIHYAGWFENKSTVEEAVVITPIADISAEQENVNDNRQSVAEPVTKVAAFEIEDLKKLRKESLIGLSKLLLTFLNDSAVIKAHEEKPLVFLVEALEKDKPDYLKEIKYIELSYDTTYKLVMDTNNKFYPYILADTLSKAYPYFVDNQNLLINKTSQNQYVIIGFGKLNIVTSPGYKSDTSVFAHESRLTSLTTLLANIYIDYYHPEHLKNDLDPLLHYLVIYHDGIPGNPYGKPIEEGFNVKAKKTAAFYIQYLIQKDNKDIIDICVPIPGKEEQVLRAGYLIN